MRTGRKAERYLVPSVVGVVAIVICVVAIGLFNHREDARHEESPSQEPFSEATDFNAASVPEPQSTPNVPAAPELPDSPEFIAATPGDVPMGGDMGFAEMSDQTGGAEITALEGLYLEDTHLITELPPPENPVPLRIHHSKDDEGTVVQKRSVLIEEYPFGMRTGRLIVTTSRVGQVNEAESTAAITESNKTLVSAVQGSNMLYMGDIDFNRSYTISEDGSMDKVQENWDTTGHWSVNIRGDWEKMTAFPQESLVLGQKYTVDTGTCIDAVPSSLTNEPAQVDLVVPRRVLFDGQEAYEVKVDQRGYAQIDVKDGDPIHAKVNGKARYYIAADTGQVLWREAEYRLEEATLTPIVGTVLRFREELTANEP